VTDIQLWTNPDLSPFMDRPPGDLAIVQGVTPEGEEFVDAYTALDMDVLDSGAITIPSDGVWAFKTRAGEAGLVIAEVSS
jgi:hypothetical protein